MCACLMGRACLPSVEVNAPAAPYQALPFTFSFLHCLHVQCTPTELLVSAGRAQHSPRLQICFPYTWIVHRCCHVNQPLLLRPHPCLCSVGAGYGRQAVPRTQHGTSGAPRVGQRRAARTAAVAAACVHTTRHVVLGTGEED